mmetsp:Transcript_65932/g.213348  ORF Transcript_65932/g.213348 Transcript_65932/m.213348 type:complete len:207 (+) Transcript_65932:237-857(+)
MASCSPTTIFHGRAISKWSLKSRFMDGSKNALSMTKSTAVPPELDTRRARLGPVLPLPKPLPTSSSTARASERLSFPSAATTMRGRLPRCKPCGDSKPSQTKSQRRPYRTRRSETHPRLRCPALLAARKAEEPRLSATQMRALCLCRCPCPANSRDSTRGAISARFRHRSATSAPRREPPNCGLCRSPRPSCRKARTPGPTVPREP